MPASDHFQRLVREAICQTINYANLLSCPLFCDCRYQKNPALNPVGSRFGGISRVGASDALRMVDK